MQPSYFGQACGSLLSNEPYILNTQNIQPSVSGNHTSECKRATITVYTSLLSMAQPQFSAQERAFMVTSYHRSRSYVRTQRDFHDLHPNKRVPTRVNV